MDTRSLFGVVAFGAVFLVVACGGRRESPTAPTTRPADVRPTTLAISGKTSIDHPGDTTQLTATATFSDQTTRDVTAESMWHVNEDVVPPVAFVSPGLLTAVSYGRTQVTAAMRSGTAAVQAFIDVRVAPAGSFLLFGSVKTTTGVPLLETEVDVRSTAGTVSARTKSDFAVYRLPARGDVVVHVEKNGFRAFDKKMTVNRDEQLDVTLARAAIEGATGTYQLTFTASGSCRLPPAALQRMYEAHVEQVNDQLFVIFDDPQFAVWAGYAGFTGRRDGDTVQFVLRDTYDDGFNLIEHIPGVGYLSYAGTAAGVMTERGISATFKGTLGVSSPPPGAPGAACAANDHRMEFVRLGASQARR